MPSDYDSPGCLASSAPAVTLAIAMLALSGITRAQSVPPKSASPPDLAAKAAAAIDADATGSPDVFKTFIRARNSASYIGGPRRIVKNANEAARDFTSEETFSQHQSYATET